jgi:hypothetical protein
VEEETTQPVLYTPQVLGVIQTQLMQIMRQSVVDTIIQPVEIGLLSVEGTAIQPVIKNPLLVVDLIMKRMALKQQF